MLDDVNVPILLVDDRPGDLLAMEAVLESPSYELVLARSGQAALKENEQRDFALVLLDVLMPDMDGMQTAQAMRRLRTDRHIPIIFVTGLDCAPGRILEAYAGGAVDLVQKPIEPVVLRSKVAVFAELYRTRIMAELQSAETDFHVLADTMPVMAWCAESNGHMSWYNRRWFEYTGTTPDQQTGVGWMSVYEPADLPLIATKWETALQTGEPWEDQSRIRRHDGQLRWFLTRAMPLRDKQGRVLRWFGISVDIDDQKRFGDLQRARAEADLFESEERFHRLVDAVTDYAIFMLDPGGHVATWNPGAEKIKGYRSDEILGKHFSIFHTPEDRARGKPERVLETVRREGHFAEEGWRVRKDGSRLWGSVTLTALRDPKGEVTGFAKVTRDLTAQRASEENERQLALEQRARAASDAERSRLLSLLEQVPAVVNVLRGPDLVFEFAHPKAIAALGGRDLVGKPLLDAIPEYRDQPEIPARIRRVYETGEPAVVHAVPVRVTNDGVENVTYWDSVVLPIYDTHSAIEGVMTFDLDVTEAVCARREMERVSRAKDEFLATMSHELRTPLNAIHGWATILRKKPRREDALERGLEVIERNARAQMRLVNDLLDVSRIISGKLDLKLIKADVLPLILAAAEVVRPAAEAKGVRLGVDVDPTIGEMMGDPDRMQQIVWNLLSNAVRFTPKGGSVTVTGERIPSGISIRVKDTGIGIATEHLVHIFERFAQVDSSTTRVHGGLGLGLSIVRHLVEAHGGSVEAHSDGPGHGAEFTVRLPIRAVNTADVEAKATAHPRGEATHEPVPTASLVNVRMLVVDDDADSRELLAMVLQEAGAQVTTAASAREAFDALGAHGPFEIILSDIGMPEVDGYSLIRTIRASGADVPAIALTAYARAEDVRQAKCAGYQGHLAKPVEIGRLIEAVRTWSSQAVTKS